MGLVIAAAERSKVTSPLRDARPRSVITVPVAECVVVFFPNKPPQLTNTRHQTAARLVANCFFFFFLRCGAAVSERKR